MKMFISRPVPVAASLAALAALLGAAALRPAPPAVLANVDGSGSTDAVRSRRYVPVLEALAGRLPAGTHWIVHRFDDRVSKAYDGYPRRAQQMWPSQDHVLKPPTTRRGSRPDLMLRHLTQTVLPACGESRIGIVFVWDGETTGAPPRAAIASLARDPRVRAVWLAGLEGQPRAVAEDDFKALGDRLVTSGLDDMPEGLQRFNELLQVG